MDNSHGETKKKSWAELKEVVSNIRKQVAAISTIIPSNINFRVLPDGRTRIYFLGSAQNGRETTLMFSDVEPNTALNKTHRLKWNQLLEQKHFQLSKAHSVEEQLLFERQRLATWGLTSYELHKTSGKLLFPANGNLYNCIDTGLTLDPPMPLFPSEVQITSTGACLLPQICPHNYQLVAYVSSSDIWVSHSEGGCTRLTHAHNGKPNIADDPLSAGIPSYVIQEEFCRYQGYWWQPESESNMYRILYEEVDESEVSIYTFPSSNPGNEETEQFRFSRAGKANAKSRLKLIQFRLSEKYEVTDLVIKEMQCPLSYYFPWYEYLVRVGWAPDSQHIWTQIVNRRQQKLSLLMIHISNFDTVLDPGNAAGDFDGSPNRDEWRLLSYRPLQVWVDKIFSTPKRPVGFYWVLYEETSRTWVNVHDLLQFVDTSDDKVSFIWASEKTGFRHLYLITVCVSMHANGAAMEEDDNNITECFNFGPRIVSEVQLTFGDWEVLQKNIYVDSKRHLIYFIGFRESPLEKHLYVVCWDEPGRVRLLTKPNMSYLVDINKDCTVMVQTYSNTETLPSCEVLRIMHTEAEHAVDRIKLISAGLLLEGNPVNGLLNSPQIYSPKLSTGETVYAMVFKPINFQPGQKYPTVLNVYGGPEVQTVNNTFKGIRQLRMHMLAAQGFCVVSIDSRGSQHRGVAFESHLHLRMGTVELKDQVEVLKILTAELGFIDTLRIAIHGWSYGGYLSLMGLIHYPDIFSVAIAGAPVTCWELYDTGYTERYMDLPEKNRDGYQAGSVLSYLNKFPDEEHRLLIIHGMIDENVHFLHTKQLVMGLIRACKPHELQVYPNERHSLRNLDASKHYETKLLAFLQNYL